MNNSQHIGVYFSDTAPEGSPFHKAEYRQSYQELSEEAARQGVQFYIVRGEESYLGDGKFSRSWQFVGDKLAETGAVQLGALYDKDRFYALGHDDIPLFNAAKLSRRCIDKSWIYEHFRSLCPQTKMVKNADELAAQVAETETEKVVVKPPAGAEGKGVQVLTKAEATTADVDFPCLVQSFLDSSAGVPGLTDGTHDLRIALLNGSPLFCFLRIPAPGSFLANIAQGGSVTLVPIADIPADALKCAQMVDQHMRDVPVRLYSVDMMLTPNGWRLIEFESSLSLQQNARGPVFENVKKQIVAAISSLCN